MKKELDKKKVLICGAGSIGVYLGVKLYSKGHDVKLFGKRKLKGVEECITIKNKKFKVPEKVFRTLKCKDYDFVFITTKLYDFDNMIKIIKKNKIKSQVFAAIQNGLVDTSKHSKVLKKKIASVIVFSGFNLKNNEIFVNPTPVGWKTEYSRDGKKISEFIFKAGIPCQPDKNLDSLRAEKTIVNCCLNALSAIENKTFSDLFKNKKTRERIEKIFGECYHILEKEYKLDEFEDTKKRMFENWEKLNHYSSTHQDVFSGRKNEIKFFNGYIVELGKKYNLPVKNNQDILNDLAEVIKIQKRDV